MTVTLTPVKPVLTVADICELLSIKSTKFYELRKEGWFGDKGPALIEIEPPYTDDPRYRGEPFALWLNKQDRLVRARLMKAVS